MNKSTKVAKKRRKKRQKRKGKRKAQAEALKQALEGEEHTSPTEQQLFEEEEERKRQHRLWEEREKQAQLLWEQNTKGNDGEDIGGRRSVEAQEQTFNHDAVVTSPEGVPKNPSEAGNIPQSSVYGSDLSSTLNKEYGTEKVLLSSNSQT